MNERNVTYDSGRKYGRYAGISEAEPGTRARLWAPDELLGFAHGLEDAATEIKAIANRKRRQVEEAEWERFMAL